METISKFFDALYSHFLLRDIVAKVLPGLLLVTGLAQFTNHQFSFLEAPFGVSSIVISVVMLYALGFAAGQLIQFLGRLPGITITHVWPPKGDRTRENRSVRKAVEFLQVVPHDHPLVRKRERMIVLKEMQGNFAISLFLFGLLQLAGEMLFTDLQIRLAFAAFCAIVAFALGAHNRALAREQRQWEREAIRRFS